jgi:type II secretory pathway pseudopilin PulG
MHVDGAWQPPNAEAIRDMAREAARFQAEMAKAQAEMARAQADAASKLGSTAPGAVAGVRITGKDGETIVIDPNTVRQLIAGVAPPPPPPPPAPWEQGPPDSVVAIIIVSILASTAVLFPIARALGRRVDRKSTTPSQTPEMASRLERIEQAVDAIAIEVERISEGQRFTTKMLGERVTEPVLVRQGVRETR